MVLPPRGTGLQTNNVRTDRGYGVPLTDAQRLVRHSQIETQALTPGWDSLPGWKKALVFLALLGGAAGGIAVLARK